MFILVSTDLFSTSLHKVHPSRLNSGLLEVEGNVSFFHVGGQEFGEVGIILW